MLRDAWRRMQRNCCPDGIDVRLRNAAAAQEITRGIGAVDLKTLVRAAM